MEKVQSTSWQNEFGQEVRMTQNKYFVGIDISSRTFMAAAGALPWRVILKPQEFSNDEDGFQAVVDWLTQHQLLTEHTIICMEATGVYGEPLAYFLYVKGYRVCVEPPLKVKRAFKPNGPKSDAVDSLQIAEYAGRYWDQLTRWQPNREIVEQIKVLLATREQFVVQRTTHKNALLAIQRKVVKTPFAEQAYLQMSEQLKKQIRAIEHEIRRLIDSEPTFKSMLLLLMSIPGVGFLLAAHLILLSQVSLDPRQLASYLGVAPNEHSSGASVSKRTSSRHFGPQTIRKLLYLAACSVRTHHSDFKTYFLRKTAEGKSARLVLNNIENKLLKIVCAVLRSSTPYIPNYSSVPLTGS
jgi:transposase